MSNDKEYKYALSKGKILKGGKYAYCIDTVLGQGGYGFTYKVSFKTKIGNIPVTLYFAVKELFVKGHCYRGADGLSMEYSEASAPEVKESLRDFITEGNRLAQFCKHDTHIVNVNEVFEANNTAYYVMEYLAEGDLRKKVLDNRGGLPEAQALSYILPVSEAVSYLHGEHMLHMDIKPENIVIRKGTDGNHDEPVLIDFGVSLHFNKKGELTSKHDSVGVSLGYTPPEQHEGIFHFAPEVDVYSLGATLYYLLTGKSPQSPSDMEPDYIRRTLPQSVSNQVREAIVHALRYNKSERTKTVADFIHELTYKEKPKKAPEIPAELPAGYVLHGGYQDYQILSTIDTGAHYIHYLSVRYTGPGSTAKVRYDLYEFFVRGVHKRQKDYKLVASSDTDKDLTEFIRDAQSKTNLSYQDGKRVADDAKTKEIFPANGTIYYVIRKGLKEKPQPGNKVLEWIRENKKNLILVAAILCVASVGYGGWQLFKSTDSHSSQDIDLSSAPLPVYASRQLTEAIKNNDSTMLSGYIYFDSIRAYLPYAKIMLSVNKIDEAREYAEKAVQAGVDGASELLEQIKNTELSDPAGTNHSSQKASDNLSSATSSEKKPGNAADNKASTTVEKKQNTNSVKNEQAEAAKKALQYISGNLTQEELDKAYQWAQKADPETKEKVMKRLKALYYVP